MPLQHGLAAGLQGVDGSVDAVIRGLFGRGKVQRAVDVDGGTAITAQHRAAVEALKKVVVIDDNHIPAGQFVRAMRLVTLGFESFELSHLLAVWKLQKGHGERGDHDYRAPLAYSAITADDVRAMVVLTTNRGGRFDVRDLGEELCGVRLEEPSDLMIEAVKGLGRLRDEGFRETFGTAEVMAYYALKQQRSGHMYGAPPLKQEPTIEQIRAVVESAFMINEYTNAVGMTELEREAYWREVVWRIRRDGGRIPGALAVVVKEGYDWARHEPDGGHDRLLWVLWTQPGTHLQDDQGYFFPAQQTFAIRQEDVEVSLPYRRGVHALVTFQGLRRVANAPIGGVPALTLIDPDQHP
jgi:hypothetical protein